MYCVNARGRDNVQSTQTNEKSIICAVNFSIFSNNICILINFYKLFRLYFQVETIIFGIYILIIDVYVCIGLERNSSL